MINEHSKIRKNEDFLERILSGTYNLIVFLSHVKFDEIRVRSLLHYRFIEYEMKKLELESSEQKIDLFCPTFSFFFFYFLTSLVFGEEGKITSKI